MSFPLAEDEQTSAGEFVHVTDHVSASVGLLRAMLRKERAEDWIALLAAPFQYLEDQAQLVYAQRFLGGAEGVQLDRIGADLAVARGALGDADYRALLRGRVRAIRSKGAVEDLIDSLRLAMDDTSVTVKVEGAGHFEQRVTLVGTVPVDPFVLQRIANDARGAHVRTVVEWTTVDPEGTFRLGDEGGSAVDGKSFDDEGGSTDADPGTMGGASE